jgi:hypothetical protein
MVHRTLFAILCCSKRKIAGWREIALFHRSLDLISLDFVFWGYIKISVYGVVGKVDSAETLKHRITVATKPQQQKCSNVFAVPISDALQEVHIEIEIEMYLFG